MNNSEKVFYGNMCFACHIIIRERELLKYSTCKLIFCCSKAHQRIHWKHHSSLCKIIQKLIMVLKPDNFESSSNWSIYIYRTNLLMLYELEVGRKLEPCEMNMILFPNNCQICHKKFDLQPCLNCLCVNYCSEGHKLADYAFHKNICHLYALGLQLHLHLEKSCSYLDYYLWKGNFSLLESIDNFIEKNFKTEDSSAVCWAKEKALISELLTCPLSLLFALNKIKFVFMKNFIIHVVGCSFLETASLKSWEIILHVVPIIKKLIIYFTGPEIKEMIKSNICISCQNKLIFKFSTEFYHDYFKKANVQSPDVVCSFNCGFHEFENSDLDTWHKTLPLLIQNEKVPLIFTSFTENEDKRDSELVIKINKKLNVNILKNKFCSLMPYRDLENLGVYFNNEYIALVLNRS